MKEKDIWGPQNHVVCKSIAANGAKEKQTLAHSLVGKNGQTNEWVQLKNANAKYFQSTFNFILYSPVLFYLLEFECMVTLIMCHGPSHQTPSNSLTVLGQIVKGCVGDSLFTIASNSSLDLPTTWLCRLCQRTCVRYGLK